MTAFPKDPREWIHTYKGHIVMQLLAELPHPDFEKLVGTDRQLDVTVTVNGRAFDFDRFAVHAQAQLERMVNEAAADLIKEKFAAMTEDVYDMLEETKRVLRNKLIDVLKHDPWERR